MSKRPVGSTAGRLRAPIRAEGERKALRSGARRRKLEGEGERGEARTSEPAQADSEGRPGHEDG
jgi:hypothetical protein